MLNYIRADLYRIFSRPVSWLVCLSAAAFPALAVLGVGEQYSMEQVLVGLQVGIYMLFLFLGLLLNEYTFREDMQLGMMKNDTTSGVSRFELYTAKYFSGMMIEVFLWVICSVASAIACSQVFGMKVILDCFGAVFSVQAISWLLNNLLLLALFQVISIFVKKTSALVLASLAISAMVGNLGTVLGKVIPGAEQMFTLFATTGQPTIFQAAVALGAPIVGIVALLLVGCALFQNSEL